jgi:hypothetical protein
MPFTKTVRIWWDTTEPGADTGFLIDAAPDAGLPADEDQDTGTVGLERGKLVVCARSGFTVPERETVIDPYTGRLIWRRFVDKLHPLDKL